MKRKKYLDADTRLPGEKRESKFALWLAETKAGMLAWIWTKRFQNRFIK